MNMIEIYIKLNEIKNCQINWFETNDAPRDNERHEVDLINWKINCSIDFRIKIVEWNYVGHSESYMYQICIHMRRFEWKCRSQTNGCTHSKFTQIHSRCGCCCCCWSKPTQFWAIFRCILFFIHHYCYITIHSVSHKSVHL